MTRRITSVLSVAALVSVVGLARAQDDPRDSGGRRVLDGPPTVLGFKNVTVEQLVPFIVEATGKVVMPQNDVMNLRVTVLNDRPLPRAQALDLVLLALHQAGVAVVENGDVITMRALAEIDRQDVPVIPASESVLRRTDLGTIAEKVFHLKHSTAKNMGDILKNAVPGFAKLTVDTESNQIAVMGNISLLRRIEAIVTSLDRPGSGVLVSETFQLRYADATQIEQNIRDLFDLSSTSGQNRAQGQQGGRGGNQQQQQLQRFFGGGDQQAQSQGNTANTQTMRVTANTQQNSVTVLAEQAILDQVRRQILDHWDQPPAGGIGHSEDLRPRVFRPDQGARPACRALRSGNARRHSGGRAEPWRFDCDAGRRAPRGAVLLRGDPGVGSPRRRGQVARQHRRHRPHHRRP